MPFGKNKKVTMPRAKKTKVAAREEALEMNDITGVTADEITGSSSPPPQQPQPTAVAPSPGRVKRKEAQVECEELYAEFGAWGRS